MDEQLRSGDVRRRHWLAALAVAGMMVVSCGTSSPPIAFDSTTSGPLSTTFDVGGAPQIASLTAEPATISPGQTSVLTWDVTDPKAMLTIDNGVGTVTGVSAVVSPSTSTVYKLTVTNTAGTASARVAVTVAAGAGGSATSPGGDSTGAAAPITGTWVNATGNLAGHASECGNLSSMSARPDKDVVLAGVASGGVWANVDGSTTDWVELGTGAGSAKISNRPSSFAFDPDHPDTWWISGIYGGGVYKTTDGGSTFSQLGSTANSDYVGVDLTDPQRLTLLSGVHETGNVDRSTDGGATWKAMTSLPADVGYTATPYVVNATTYLLGTVNGAKSGIYRTSDSGVTWTLVQAGGVAGQPLVMSDGRIYWAVSGSALVTSTDQGTTWTAQSNGLSLGNVVATADGQIAAVVQNRISTSADQGATWTPVSPDLPYVANGMTYSIPRNAFYIWRNDCDFSRPDPVLPDAIMRLDTTGATATTTVPASSTSPAIT